MRVCLITSRDLLPEPGALARRVAAAAAAGVDLVQVRERDLAAGRLAELTRELQAAVRGITPRGGTKLLVNGRVDVALACGADGVHLPQEGLPAADVRRLAPPGFLVGVSVHDAAGLARAQSDGADYALLGPLFPTLSHPGTVCLGLERAAALAASVRIPVWAVGGIEPSRALALAHAPLAGVAAIRGLLVASDLAAAVAALRAIPTRRS